MQELAGKVALVTGGATDIGRAICLSLAEAGAQVAINYCTNQAGAEAALRAVEITFAALVKTAGWREEPSGAAPPLPGGMIYQADVSSPAATKAMIQAVVERLGRLDILVNGVGTVAPKKALWDWTEEDWNAIVGATLKGTFFCSQQAAEQMKERGWGRIIQITTTATLLANDYRTPYIAAKGGVEAMSRALAIELAPFGITVNMVAPPVVKVSRNRNRWDFYDEKLTPFIPMGRMAEPRDIGQAVALFASPKADFITGQILRVDGGWTSRPAYPAE